jgi:hypothetical protein
MFDPNHGFVKRVDCQNHHAKCITYHNENIYIDGSDIIKLNMKIESFEYINFYSYGEIPPFILMSMNSISISYDNIVYFTGNGITNDTINPLDNRYDTTYSYIGKYDLISEGLEVKIDRDWPKDEYYGPNFPGLCVDNKGSLFLAAYYDESFHIYDENLDFTEKIALNSSDVVIPNDVLVQNNKVFVVERANNSVHVFRPTE